MERRLSAILAADVVGYSRLMGKDEAGTLAALKQIRTAIFDSKATQHSGRTIKLMGDGILMEFGSVVDAVLFAIDVQTATQVHNSDIEPSQQIIFRIGINIGDVIVEDDDIYGDGVNVAARLEGLAVPGGICIGRSVRDQIRDKLDLNLEDLGETEVKNIARAVRAFRIMMDAQATALCTPVVSPTVSQSGPAPRILLAALVGCFILIAGGVAVWWQPWVPAFERASASEMKFSLPDKPSIAVLPFENLSDKEGQDFFADGMTDDIITDLSKISGIFVTARHSIVGYKKMDVKIHQIAQDLGVRYVLSGSVRRAGEQIRITAQLADAIKGNILWSDRYDRQVQDVFAVQSEVTKSVVKAMAVTLKAREEDRVFQKYVTNIEAYDVWQQARAIVEVPSRNNVSKGEALFKKTIELDPKFAGGYAGLGFNYSVKARFGFGESRQDDAERSLTLAKKAIEIDPDLAWSHIALAGAYLANRQYDASVDAARKALAIQPGGYETNLFMGFYLSFAGLEPALAVKHSKIADNMSRVPTYRGLFFLGMSYFFNRQYAESEATWLRIIKEIGPVKHNSFHVYLAASQSALNKMDRAAVSVANFLRISPKFRLSKWHATEAMNSGEFLRRILRLAVKAGFPE